CDCPWACAIVMVKPNVKSRADDRKILDIIFLQLHGGEFDFCTMWFRFRRSLDIRYSLCSKPGKRISNSRNQELPVIH
ncbi:MAG TPA: hypothetical protein VFS91_03155, partial [Nitrobacter sp.]|nr:hypothetical protein [Nitrobacter sp.]